MTISPAIKHAIALTSYDFYSAHAVSNPFLTILYYLCFHVYLEKPHLMCHAYFVLHENDKINSPSIHSELVMIHCFNVSFLSWSFAYLSLNLSIQSSYWHGLSGQVYDYATIKIQCGTKLWRLHYLYHCSVNGACHTSAWLIFPIIFNNLTSSIFVLLLNSIFSRNLKC